MNKPKVMEVDGYSGKSYRFIGVLTDRNELTQEPGVYIILCESGGAYWFPGHK